MSKIFNFLSYGTYSSLGVGFFRFPSGPEGGERGDSQKPQAEQPRPLKEILEDVKNAIDYLNKTQIPLVKDAYLKFIQNRYYELKYYEDKDKRARETLKTLREILENNGRNPV